MSTHSYHIKLNHNNIKPFIMSFKCHNTSWCLVSYCIVVYVNSQYVI